MATTQQPAPRLVVLLLALLLVLPAVAAFIIPATRLSSSLHHQSTRPLRATASFIPGGDSSSGNQQGPLASVPTVDSLEELERLTKGTGDRPLVLRYHASWCSACKKFAPSWLQAAGAYSGPDGFDFMDVDVTNKRDIITAMGLTVLPHCHIYRRGQQVESIPVSVKKLNNLLEKLEQLKGQA